jgi:hypothetical protein
MKELPDEIVDGMTPILARFGINDQSNQGRVIVKIGKIIRGMNRQKITSSEDAANHITDTIRKMSVVLNTYGITNEKDRQKCTYEIWQFIDDLAQKVIGEEKERLK